MENNPNLLFGERVEGDLEQQLREEFPVKEELSPCCDVGLRYLSGEIYPYCAKCKQQVIVSFNS